MSKTGKELVKLLKPVIKQSLKYHSIIFSDSDSQDSLLKKLIGVPSDGNLNINANKLRLRCKELGIKSTGIVTDLISNIIENKTTVQNRGTGAGGKNTNKSGISYEQLTNLIDELTIIDTIKSNNKTFNKIKFNNSNTIFTQLNKAKLFHYMKINDNLDTDIKQAHGCKQPDECYVDENKKNIFIIEKKFQQCSGSVCEKIQTYDFKLWQYSRQFPEYNIIYIYCLSTWFKLNCIAELEYLDYKHISYFFGDDENYKKQIIDFITNYK